MRAKRVALGLSVIALVAALSILLLQTSVHRSHANNAAPLQPFALEPGDPLCTDEAVIAADTATLQLAIAGEPTGPATRVTVTTPERQPLTAVTVPAGWSGDRLEVPLRNRPDHDVVARACAEIVGSGIAIAMVGARSDGSAVLRLDQLRPEPETWIEMLPVVAQRIGFAHARDSRLAAAVGLLSMLAVAALALGVAMRSGP